MNRASARQLLVTFVPPSIVLAGVAIVGFALGKDIGRFLRDPMATAGLHPLTGFVSNLGVLLWAASGAVCLFAGMVVRRTNSGDAAGFLISAASLSLYLCLDDLFLVHESLVPTYLGISETYFYVALAIATLTYLVRYWRMILSTNYLILLVALAFLGASAAIDEIFEPYMRAIGQGRIFLEDGSKWLGIAAWCSYHVGTSFELVTGTNRVADGSAAAQGTVNVPTL
jgi:hypothetical protein